MKIKWSSWTILFNLILLGLGVFAPRLNNESRTILITNGIAGIGLRAKTKEALWTKKEP
jgi:hypothetical protein